MERLTKEEINKELKNRTDFYDILLTNTKHYSGEFELAIKNAPKIYDLLCKLLTSENISKEYRIKISAVIAYFILPRDVYSENIFGARGYADDVFLCLHILREIRDEYEIEEIIQYWDGDCKLLESLLNDAYIELSHKFEPLLNDILEYIGLK